MDKPKKAWILAFKMKIDFQTVALHSSVPEDSWKNLSLSYWQRWKSFFFSDFFFFFNVDPAWFVRDQSVSKKNNLEMDSKLETP